ncbi:MAG: CD3073 family putative ECF transporter S component [Bacillota bacterium]
MRNEKTRILVFCAISIAANIVLGILTSALKLPLYLDTIGTVFVAVYAGPWYGAAVGGLTNLLTGILYNVKDIPFLLVSVVIALVVGFIAKRFTFKFHVALITGLLLSIIAPLIGTPIGIWVYGGLTGTGMDFLFLWLRESGTNIFAASFIPKVINNLLDKVGTCLLVYLLWKKFPAQYKLTSQAKTKA